MVDIPYQYNEVKKEASKCTKPNCFFCATIKDNDGKVSEKGLLKLGLATKEKATLY